MPREATRPIVRRAPAIDKLLKDVGKPMLGVDVIELARLDQRSQHRPILSTLVATGEQRVLGIELDWPHRPLDRVRVHFDAPVVKIQRQTIPMTQRIAQSFGRLALLREWAELRLEPLLQGDGERPGMGLPLGGGSAAQRRSGRLRCRRPQRFRHQRHKRYCIRRGR